MCHEENEALLAEPWQLWKEKHHSEKLARSQIERQERLINAATYLQSLIVPYS